MKANPAIVPIQTPTRLYSYVTPSAYPRIVSINIPAKTIIKVNVYSLRALIII